MEEGSRVETRGTTRPQASSTPSVISNVVAMSCRQYDYLNLRNHPPRFLTLRAEADDTLEVEGKSPADRVGYSSGSIVYFSDTVHQISTGMELNLIATGTRLYLFPRDSHAEASHASLTLHLSEIDQFVVSSRRGMDEIVIRARSDTSPDWWLKVPHLIPLLDVIKTNYDAAQKSRRQSHAMQENLRTSHSQPPAPRVPSILLTTATSLKPYVIQLTAIEEYLLGRQLPFEKEFSMATLGPAAETTLLGSSHHLLTDDLRQLIGKYLVSCDTFSPSFSPCLRSLNSLLALVYTAPAPPSLKHWSWVTYEMRTQVWTKALLLLTKSSILCLQPRRFIKFRNEGICREPTLASFSALENQHVESFASARFSQFTTESPSEHQPSDPLPEMKEILSTSQRQPESVSSLPVTPSPEDGVISASLFVFSIHYFGTLANAITASFAFAQCGTLGSDYIPNHTWGTSQGTDATRMYLTLACRTESECKFWIDAFARHLKPRFKFNSSDEQDVKESRPSSSENDKFETKQTTRPKIIMVDHSWDFPLSEAGKQLGKNRVLYTTYMRSEGWVYRFDDRSRTWKPCYLVLSDADMWCFDVNVSFQMVIPSTTSSSADPTSESKESTQTTIGLTKLSSSPTVRQELPELIARNQIRLSTTMLPPHQNMFDVRFAITVANRERAFAVDSQADYNLWEAMLDFPRLSRRKPQTDAPKVNPPAEPLTFVHTDIEGSTTAWETEKDMFQALKLHDNVMWEAIKRFNGREGGTQGDAFQVIFRDPVAALRWCLSVQQQLVKVQWPENFQGGYVSVPTDGGGSKILFAGPRVRMGIHTGSNVEKYYSSSTRREQLEGCDAEIGQKVADTAHGGQIVLTKQALDAIQNSPGWKSIQHELDCDGFVFLASGYFEAAEDLIEIYEAKQSLFREREFPPLRNVSKKKKASSYIPLDPQTIRNLEALVDWDTNLGQSWRGCRTLNEVLDPTANVVETHPSASHDFEEDEDEDEDEDYYDFDDYDNLALIDPEFLDLHND